MALPTKYIHIQSKGTKSTLGNTFKRFGPSSVIVNNVKSARNFAAKLKSNEMKKAQVVLKVDNLTIKNAIKGVLGDSVIYK